MPTKSPVSEVSVMQTVDEAFRGLDPEARQRIIDWVSAKYDLTAKPKVIQPATVKEVGLTPSAPGSIKGFMSEKRPQNSYQRVACLVYYLEKFEGVSEVGSAEIVKANSDARLSRMTNPSLFIQHATHTYGYLTSLGKRKFAISARGEAVVEALPDEAKVEEVHDRLPIRRKSKKGSKGKR